MYPETQARLPPPGRGFRLPQPSHSPPAVQSTAVFSSLKKATELWPCRVDAGLRAAASSPVRWARRFSWGCWEQGSCQHPLCHMGVGEPGVPRTCRGQTKKDRLPAISAPSESLRSSALHTERTALSELPGDMILPCR